MPAWHLRPRSAPEVIDASIQLLRQQARPLLLLSIVLVIPGTVLSLLNSLVIGDITSLGKSGALSSIGAGAALGLVPAVILGTCWFFVAFGALVGAASTAYVEGTSVEPGEALRRVWPRATVLLGAGVLTYLLVMVQLIGLMGAFMLVAGVAGGAIAVVTRSAAGSTGGTAVAGVFALVMGIAAFVGVLCGGAWLVGRYATLLAVAANEQLGVRATMRRARELSRGSAGRVTVLMLLVGVLFFVVAIGGFIVLGALLRNTMAASAVMSVVYVPLYALGATLITVLYYDLRVRHEGLDIELLARELSTEPTLAGDPAQ